MQHMALYGPTASGKTKLSLEIAEGLNNPISIVNFDSCQFLDYLPSLTMLPEKSIFTEHLFGISKMDSPKFTGANFINAVEKINKMDTNPKLFVGGSGFYLLCLINGMSPYIHKEKNENLWSMINARSMEENYGLLSVLDPNHKLHVNDHYRIKNYLYFVTVNGYGIKQQPTIPIIPKQNMITIFLNPSTKWLCNNIEKRTDLYFQKIIEEVKSFYSLYPDHTSHIIGYREIQQYIDGLINREKAKELINIRTRQYAKTQRTFLKNKIPHDLIIDEYYKIEELIEAIKRRQS